MPECANKIDGPNRAPTYLLDLVDDVSRILETDTPAQETATYLIKKYGDDAMDIAEACAKSYPGARNVNKAAYWAGVCSAILQSGITTH